MKDKKLKIILISPKMSLRPMDSEFKRRMSPSYSLVVLASLTPKQHDVFIADENIQELDFEDKPDIIGINVNVDTAYRAIEISKIYREKGTSVIFGGIHASSQAEHLIYHCDSICIGEAEDVWEKMLQDHIDNKLEKFYTSKNTDLKKVPIPDWNFIKKENYLYNNIIVVSRGCPHKCDFCYNSCSYMTSKYRNRPIESVIQEIEAQDTKQIMFIDDNIIGNMKWIEEFLDRIDGKNYLWHAAVSTRLVHYPELIDKMAKTGCRSLFIGFESINQKAINNVNKSQNKIEEYEILISKLHEHNIMVNASLVFGFDEDDNTVFDNTLKWLVKNKVETMTGHILTPYPGTKLYEKMKSEGRIIDHNLRNYNTSNVVFQPKLMSKEELRNGYLKIYNDFYSIKNIIRRLPKQKKIRVSYLLFNLAYRKFGKFVSSIGKLGFMRKIGKIARKLSYGID